MGFADVFIYYPPFMYQDNYITAQFELARTIFFSPI